MVNALVSGQSFFGDSARQTRVYGNMSTTRLKLGEETGNLPRIVEGIREVLCPEERTKACFGQCPDLSFYYTGNRSLGGDLYA